MVYWLGKIVEDLHAPCLAGMEKCDLIAVCDLREDRLAHAKSEYGCQDVDTFLSHQDVQSVIARN